MNRVVRLGTRSAQFNSLDEGKAMIDRRTTVRVFVVGSFALAAILCALISNGAWAQRPPFELPKNISRKPVVIWSEGVRLAGDVYAPKSMKAGDRLPAIILCHGWGGTKLGLQRYGAKFAAAGYVVLAFDYRGWGESGSKLVVIGDTPEADDHGEATVKVRVVREVVDPIDEAQDIHHAINFMMGEPGVDTNRIGLWGSSYGGGLIIWMAAHDERVKCLVSQVPGMGVMSDQWRKLGAKRAIEIARGDVEAIPQTIDAVEGLRGVPHVAKMTLYGVVGVAHRVSIPTMIIDAENEELMNRLENGRAVYKIIKRRGRVPVEYHVIRGISHYDIYRDSYRESTDLAVGWFNKHLKKAGK